MTRLSDRLAGKTALVTGVASGIGKGCALMFARHGARVFGCDVAEAGAAAAVAEARAEGLEFESLHPCDLTDEADVQRFVAWAAGHGGGVDVLVNSAATAVFAPIEDLTLADWRLTLAAELDSVFLVCRAAWPHLKARGGSIINFASANAHVALEGSPALAHCAGKGGILAMTRQLAMEGGPHGVRANTISPALIVTGATAPRVASEPGFKDRVMAKLMIKRLGQPEDIAWCATFLASDESTWVTGADFRVDGGALAW